MDIDEIKKLMEELESSTLHKIVYKKGDFEIHLEKQSGGTSLPAFPTAPQVTAALPVVPAPEKEQEGSFITSPMVGTFYSAGGPDQPPFVKVGDKIVKGTVICIVEAMKVMNEVKADVSGTVAEVIPQNGQAVEFGSRLFRVI